MRNARRGALSFGVWIMGLVLCALGTACSAPTPTPPPPSEIVAGAITQFNATQSFHFVVEFSGKPTYLDAARTLALRRMEGDLVRPDKMRVNIKASLPGAFVLMQAVGVGDDQFATNPLNGQWQKIPTEWGFNPSGLFRPDTGLSGILAQGTGLALKPDETIENQRNYHLAGEIAGDRIAPLTGWLTGAGRVDFELWIGASDKRLHRIRLVDNSTEPAASGTPAPPAQWNMDFSQFDAPVPIETPVVTQ